MADAPPFVASGQGTEALIATWRRRRDQQFIAAVANSSGRSEVIAISEVATAELTGHAPNVVVSFPEILVGAVLIEKGRQGPDGDFIVAVTPLFRRFLRELDRDANALYRLDPRQFEELIAGAYEEAGCEEVVLTPRSGDRGRDVIATSRLFGTVRILDQVKLFAPHRPVEANDVRALNGVLGLDQGASKGIITTTSTFAPGVYDEFRPLMPGRIFLRDGGELRRWLHEMTI